MAIVSSVYVEDFAGSTPQAKIQAALDYASVGKNPKLVIATEEYYLTGTVTIKKGVKLQGSYGAKFVIGKDVRAFELEKDASLLDARIMVDYKGYSKEVIYLDGKHNYYNTWYNTSLKNIVIVNWTGKVSGTGIYLYSGGKGHEISFVDFENIKIVSFAKGIHLKASKPPSGFAYVNANRFDKFSIEDCIDNIVLEGSETIPNECSGNAFTNLQIQPSNNTQRIITMQGQYNKFEGMCWDLHEIKHNNAVVEFKKESNYNELNMKSIPSNRISNLGKSSNK